MKHGKSAKMALAWVAAVIMLLSLSACASGPATTTAAPETQAATPAATATPEQSAAVAPETAAPAADITEVSILSPGTGNKLDQYTDSRTQQAMAKAAGVKIKLVQADTDKVSVLLAGGDLPDLVKIGPSYFNQLIEGNQVIPMDDLIASNGKNMLVTIPDTLNFVKKYWSDGKNQIYFIPVQVGLDGQGLESWMSGVRIRWDYYKELGYPPVNSLDDFLNVLGQIVKKHPTTDDGKPIYGVSMFNDWGPLWSYMYPMNSILGYYQVNNSQSELLNVGTNQMTNMALDENASYWQSVKYYNKAYQMGILDPDALTQKEADLAAKATAGQVISGVIGGDYNTNNAKDGKGFVNLAVNWGFSWGDANNLAGWPDKSYGITTNCKAPDKAMNFLNYIYSYDGCRTLFSGIEGTDWSVVNGAPTESDNTIALSLKGGDDWAATGIGFDQNFVGLSPFTLDPTDKKPLSLFQDPALYAKELTPLQQDYDSYYKGDYPQKILEDLVASGKTKNQSGENTLATALLPSPDDDTKRMEASLSDVLAKDGAKLIMAKSDTEFDAMKQQAMADFKTAGAETINNFWQKAWTTAVDQASALK